MSDSDWFKGSGEPILFSDLLKEAEQYVEKGGKIFIGTDSQLGLDSCVFVTAVCLHGKPMSKGGRYFFKKTKTTADMFRTLKVRIMHEVQNSIEIALHMIEKSPRTSVEIHLDIGTTEKSKTRSYVDELKGWTQSIGFACKVKPNAWASASVADKHTK